MIFKFFTLFVLLTTVNASTLYLYNCTDDYHFVVEQVEDEARIFLQDRWVIAKRVLGVSSKQYKADKILYEVEGEEANLTISGKYYRCGNDSVAAAFKRAELEGVVFRAVGYLPEWVLEISSDKKVHFVTNHGENLTAFKVTEKYLGYETIEYKMHSQNNIMFVRVEARLCYDQKRQRSYEHSVYINFDGYELRGCGKAL